MKGALNAPDKSGLHPPCAANRRDKTRRQGL
jgi:hypothetical protein